MEVDVVTFDDYLTLRYSPQQEDIIFPILWSLKEKGFTLNEEVFLMEYQRIDRSYRKRLRESYRESILDDIVLRTVRELDRNVENWTIKSAVDDGLRTRRSVWYPDSIPTLIGLSERGYMLGLISNTHWRWLPEQRDEVKKYFQTVTLSYEIGYVKPHPNIFLATLEKMRAEPERCLHVGDDLVADIEGAKNVGMKTAFLKRGKMEANSDIQLKRLNELLGVL